jgi:hypothetical protein
VIPLDELRTNPEVSLTFGMVIDPVTKEKKKKIRKWLAQNQVNLPSAQPSATDSKTPATQPPTSGSVSRGLFGQILESELGDEIESGKWAYISPKQPISIKDVTNEK